MAKATATKGKATKETKETKGAKGKASTATTPKAVKETTPVVAKETNIIANKTSLIADTAKAEDVSVVDVTRIVNQFLGLMQGAVVSLQPEQKVKIGGLGTFEVREGNARTGRNPVNGDSVEVPAKLRPKFTIESGLKKAATSVL